MNDGFCVVCGEPLIYGIDEYDSDGIGRCEDCAETKMMLDVLDTPFKA